MSLILIFVASLLGSPHCAAMCGGFVAISSQSSTPVKSQSIYHLGRLITYTVLGTIAGSIGTAMDSAGEGLGITQMATIFTALLLIVWGLAMLFGRSLGIHKFLPIDKLFAVQQRLIPPRSRPYLYPFSLGLTSTLLPCGWLYTYVVVAAGTASPVWGTLVMMFFWVGTLPMLITVGSLSNLITSPLKRYVPTVASLLMIAAGASSLAGHLGYGFMSHHGHGNQCTMPEHSTSPTS
jgi:sulfite exporter TauE/SafE